MSRIYTMPVDPIKFENAIIKIGGCGSMREFSVESGHQPNYCVEIKNRTKRITKAFLVFLNSKGIAYDDICPDPEPEVIEEPVVEGEANDEALNENVTISVKDLSEVVAVAIYTAFVNLHKDGII